MILLSGPVRHNPTGAGTGTLVWWVTCTDCEAASTATVAQVGGQDAHTCPDCGRIVTGRLLSETQIEDAYSRKRRRV